MHIVYTYKEKDYRSSYQVRQDIWKNDHIVYPAEPSDKSVDSLTEFYTPFGVTVREEADPEPSIDEIRQQKQMEMESRFDSLQRDCHFVSSIGIDVNGDETANRNVDMLIRYFPEGVETVEFCGYDNTMYSLKKADLETILQEIVINAQYLYAQKWAYREAIAKAETKEAIEAIEIKFVCKEFS